MNGGFAYFTWTVADIDRFQAFWTALFGWEFSKGSAGGYHVVNANVPLGVRSGLVSRTDPDISFTFAVTNMHRAVAQVRELGGTAGDPTGDARWNTAECRDDQGIPFTLWEPSPGGEFQFDAMWAEQQKAFIGSTTTPS